MPGRPKLRTLAAAIEANGGLDVYLDKIADGRLVSTLCEELGVSRRLFMEYVEKQPDGMDRYRHARRIAAASLADQTHVIAAGATLASERVDRLRIDTNKWLARCADPDTYGDNRANIQINVGPAQLHLDALRKVTIERAEQRRLTDDRLQLPAANEPNQHVSTPNLGTENPVIDAEFTESTG